MKIDHEGDPCLSDRLRNLFDIFPGCGQRFFHDDVLPWLGGRDDGAAMREIRRYHGHSVNFRVALHFVIVGVDSLCAVSGGNLTGSAFVKVADGG